LTLYIIDVIIYLETKRKGHVNNMNERAKIILEQLGGNHFMVMTGAKLITYDDNSISLSLPRNISKANKFSVTLDGDDTYTMKFYSTTRKEPMICAQSGLYFNMLQPEFTRVTGMDTKLF